MPKGKTSPTADEHFKSDTSVYYEKSLTKNLGNYESARVTVGVTLPINPTGSDVAAVKATIEVADDIVTDELEVQLKELLGKK